MNLGETLPPHGSVKRPTHNRECLVAITEALNASGQILGMLNQAIHNPRATIPEIANILRCDGVLSALIVKFANSAFFFKSSNLCNSIEDALRLVGLREIARLITTATVQGAASPSLCA